LVVVSGPSIKIFFKRDRTRQAVHVSQTLSAGLRRGAIKIALLDSSAAMRKSTGAIFI
jgi:hypothetical protein